MLSKIQELKNGRIEDWDNDITKSISKEINNLLDHIKRNFKDDKKLLKQIDEIISGMKDEFDDLKKNLNNLIAAYDLIKKVT